MNLIDKDRLLDIMQCHLDSTYMSVCLSVEECTARRFEIQNCIDIIKDAPTFDFWGIVEGVCIIKSKT